MHCLLMKKLNQSGLLTPPKNRLLTKEEKLKFNERIIIEKFFGRAKMLFQILRSKFRGSRESLNDIVTICFALTNYHVSNNPLNIKDHNYYSIIKENLMENKRKLFKEENDDNNNPRSSISSSNVLMFLNVIIKASDLNILL